MQSYDVIVIGAGPTGENVADYAHRGGLSAAVVECELVGGECSYWACMPSKALLWPGAAVNTARGIAGSREAVTGQIDVDAVLQRRNSFTSNWDDSGQVEWADGAGIDVIRGHGRIAGERRVDVARPDGSTLQLEARRAVVVATGTAAKLPPIDGLAEAKPWTSREVTAAEQVPGSLVVIGGGVVAVEMADAYRSLGAEVTILAVDERLLQRMPAEAGKRLQSAFEDRGISVRLQVGIESVRRHGDRVTVELPGGEPVTADEVLVATGRRPRSDDIGLDTVGLEPGRYLDVDDTMLVKNVDGEWLYACGDVNGRALLTHMGKYQARACGAAIAARASGNLSSGDTLLPWSDIVATADHAAVPQVTFTDPEIASVGLTEQQARDAGIDVVTVEYEIGSVAGAALLRDEYDGWAQLVVDSSRQILVGACFVGPLVGELLHSATVAIVGEVTLDRLWHAVPSYPTVSEIWLRLLEKWRFEEAPRCI